MSNLTTAIKVKNLSFYYGNYKAIQGISLDIYKNQVTALIGPSGCGKSTFIKTINRISELEGKVKVEGNI
ncbi:MAG: ATP-binding cassette domain-containing protein, partial [Dolichospermum sp.]